MRGNGEGCDYTIGCDFRWETIEASDKKDALKKAKERCEDFGDQLYEAHLVIAQDVVKDLW